MQIHNHKPNPVFVQVHIASSTISAPVRLQPHLNVQPYTQNRAPISTPSTLRYDVPFQDLDLSRICQPHSHDNVIKGAKTRFEDIASELALPRLSGR